ncbi:sugar transferase [Bdellovibrionota bacterium FG-2]
MSVLVAFLTAFWIYTGPLLSRSSPQNFWDFLGISIGTVCVYVIALDRVGLYKREVSLLNIKELRGIFRAAVYSTAVILSASFYVRFTSLSRITITVALAGAPLLIYLQRQVFFGFHLFFHRRGWSQNRVLIFGAGRTGKHLARRMFESPGLGLLPVGVLDDDRSRIGQLLSWRGTPNVLPVLGGEEQLDNVKSLGVDLVVISLPGASLERNKGIVNACIAAGIPYAVVPNSHEEFIQQMEVLEIGGIPLFRRRSNKKSWTYLASKRLIDFVLSSAVMICLSPLYFFFAGLIRLDSKGPVIFKQKRVGLNGREFSFYKFRTMHVHAPKYAETPHDPKDDRITRLGGWLRRTSLDELPQLFNVFRGDMSLVGPRPEMPFIVERYTPLEKQRLEAKPGITGVWQISAVRGEPIHANIEYDLFYLQNRSLLLDAAIVVKTVLSVIRGVGAI